MGRKVQIKIENETITQTQDMELELHEQGVNIVSDEFGIYTFDSERNSKASFKKKRQ